MNATKITCQRRQRGVTLIEAMVAMVIMAFGMVALVGLQSNMRRSADLAKQRGEAVRLAQQQIEQLRAYTVLAIPANPAPGVRAFDSIAVAGDINDAIPSGSNATFSLVKTVTPWREPSQPGPTMQAVTMTVSWNDRTGEAQRVQLHSFISRADPGLGGALGVAPVSAPLRAAGGRHPVIPVTAKDLGNKTSVFVPPGNATVAWVFNNLTGVIVGRCTVAMATTSATLSAAELSACASSRTLGFLLSGLVRFSLTSPPSSELPASLALPSLDFAIVGGDALRQARDKPNTVDLAVPAAPSYQCFNDSTADSTVKLPFVSYYCVVFPNADTTPSWTGKLNVTGLSSDYKVCRYSADYDGDGRILNTEHPLNYCTATKSMARQNFLVVKSSEYCPVGHAVDASQGYFSNTATVAHEVENRTLPYPDPYSAITENRCPGP